MIRNKIEVEYKRRKHFFQQDKTLMLIVFIACVIGVISYFWKPEDRFDLSVIYKITSNYRHFGMEESIKYMISRGEVLTMFYLYLMSHISDMSYIQILPTFLFVLFSGLYLKKCFEIAIIKERITSVALGLSILIIFSRTTFLYVFSSFRFWVAFIIFIYFIINKYDIKKHGWVYLMFPILLHNSIILFAFLYLISKLDIKKGIIIIMLCFTVLYSVQFGLEFFSNILPYDGFIGELLRKYQLYFSPRFVMSRQYIFLVFELGIYLVTFYRYSKNSNISHISSFAGILLTFGLLTLLFADLNFRNLEILRFLMFPINLSVLSKLRIIEKNILDRTLLILILILIIGGITIQYTIYRLDILPNIKTGGHYVS